MYQQELIRSGLDPKEALVYDLLLTENASPVAQIVKNTKLKRGLTYKILYSLEEKGLVAKFKKNKKLYFKANHPYALLEQTEQELTQVQNRKLNLENVLPQLVSSFRKIESQPGVRTYEGIEGIKEVYKDTLKEGKEIWAILQTSEVEPKLFKWLTQVYVKERAKKKIKAKVIAAQDIRTKEYKSKDQQEERNTLVVPKKKFPVGIEVDIYGDKVGFMTFRKNAEHVGIIIENKLIADTMRALFQLAWEKAKEYDKKVEYA